MNLKTIYITYLSTILPTEIPAIFSVHCNLILFYSASPKMTLFGCTLQMHFMPPLFHSLGANTVGQMYLYSLTVLMDPLGA